MTSPKPKRAQRSVSLSPALDAQLQTEADRRMIHASLLIENALTMYLPTLPPLPNGDAPAT